MVGIDEVEEIYDTMSGGENEDDNANDVYENNAPQNDYEDVMVQDYHNMGAGRRLGFRHPAQTTDEIELYI